MAHIRLLTHARWQITSLTLVIAAALITSFRLGTPEPGMVQDCFCPTPGEPTPTATPPAVWPAVVLSTERRVYPLEEPVIITFTVINHNPFTYTVKLPSAQPYWVEIRDSNDRPVWGPPCAWPPTVTCLDLPPSSIQHYSGYCLTWERYSIALPDPGVYTIYGNLPATCPGVIRAEPQIVFVGSAYRLHLPTVIRFSSNVRRSPSNPLSIEFIRENPTCVSSKRCGIIYCLCGPGPG